MHEVTTVEELDALPAGSVILDKHRQAWQKVADTRWHAALWKERRESAELGAYLAPFTVLFRPDAPQPATAAVQADWCMDPTCTRGSATTHEGTATTVTDDDLVQRIRAEADMASRAGQSAVLHKIADDLAARAGEAAPTDGWVERVAALLPEDYAIYDDPRRVIEAAIPRLLGALGEQFDRGVSAAEGAWGQPVSRAEVEAIRGEHRAAGAGAEVDQEALREAMLSQWWINQTGPDADLWETLDDEERENVAENSYADTFLYAVMDFLAAARAGEAEGEAEREGEDERCCSDDASQPDGHHLACPYVHPRAVGEEAEMDREALIDLITDPAWLRASVASQVEGILHSLNLRVTP